ncbi:MAG TPA: uracil-DNA glycosylase [Kurthia sp.]
MFTNNLPQDWQQKLQNVLESKSFEALTEFVEEAYETTEVFPPKDQIWQAFQSTSYDEVKVVILGQDPYHDHGQAHGLSFSVKEGVKIPPSLRNMYKELASDLQIPEPQSGNLQHWADQGILLLNTVLTVEAHKAHSHKGRGWEIVTDEVIRQLNNREKPVIFVLWGKPAQQKKALIDTNRHFIIENVHPSPLSAYRGFFGSKPYSAINNQLMAWGQKPIEFNCPNDEQLHLQL